MPYIAWPEPRIDNTRVKPLYKGMAFFIYVGFEYIKNTMYWGHSNNTYTWKRNVKLLTYIYLIGVAYYINDPHNKNTHM